MKSLNRLFFLILALMISVANPVFADGVENEGVLSSALKPKTPSLMMTPLKEATGATQRVFSSEHVNLVRVLGETINDVVYDAEALEVQADKVHGVVFISAKPSWLTSGKSKTAAFFNTETHSYGLLLEALPIAPQTIEIASTAPIKPESIFPRALAKEAMAHLTTDSYVANLKELVQRALKSETLPEVEVGTAFSPKDKAFEALSFEARAWDLKGLRFEQKRAFATRDYVIDVVKVRNLTVSEKYLSLGTYAKVAPGVLALAAGLEVLSPAAVTDLVFISSRNSRETSEGILLAIDCFAKYFLGNGRSF